MVNELNFQRRARRVLRGKLQLHVRRADVVKLLGHDVLGDFGLITFAAQVREVKVFQFCGHDLRGGFGGGDV